MTWPKDGQRSRPTWRSGCVTFCSGKLRLISRPKQEGTVRVRVPVIMRACTDPRAHTPAPRNFNPHITWDGLDGRVAARGRAGRARTCHVLTSAIARDVVPAIVRARELVAAATQKLSPFGEITPFSSALANPHLLLRSSAGGRRHCRHRRHAGHKDTGSSSGAARATTASFAAVSCPRSAHVAHCSVRPTTGMRRVQRTSPRSPRSLSCAGIGIPLRMQQQR